MPLTYMLTDHKHNLHVIMAMYCGGVEVISDDQQ
jgi:hypothetical protein